MVKLGDFGLAVQLEHSCSRRNSVCGTSMYMGPEVYEEGACLKSDVWSLGISIIEMAEGKNPMASCSSFQVMKRVCEGEPPLLSSSGWSSDLIDFVRRCLVKDVNERASVEELLRVGVSYVSLDVAPVRARRGGANRGRWELCRPVGAGKTCGERGCE